ncbi:helix-turn-helix transcriptional regulator [Agrobacterium tumefaciens]|uniref:helix-turn-helix domain-containing protein n=1 Tax=Agrobacterium tumefaciens TaxID=358 RepID=UPI001BB75734|nr:helix-turn-helix transcriptional regulator [Agrobacterium tumefaciens]
MEHPITTYRRNNFLTQAAFGRLVGATKGMVSRWEASLILPRPDFIEKIENVTNGLISASAIVRAFNFAHRRLEAAE